MVNKTLFAFLLGLAGCAVGAGADQEGLQLTVVPVQVAAPAPPVVLPLMAADRPFVAVSARVRPAVVGVRADYLLPLESSPSPLWPSPWQGPLPEGGDYFFRQSGGTGFIVHPDGLILTNNHVVAGAKRIRVTLMDNREYEAVLVGADPTTDVAVLRITRSEPFPFLGLSLDREAEVGEWVLAFGNPFGLSHTVTAGIVSARGRTLGLLRAETSWAVEDYIQTDAAINQGSSGGPLVGLDGLVLGINSAIDSRSGTFSGYGFAVPIGLAAKVMDDLVNFGVVQRAVLGVGVAVVTQLDAEALALPRPAGARITFLIDAPGGGPGPAAAAGLRRRDVVWEIEGTEVAGPGDLSRMIALHRPGETVTLTVFRNRAKMEVAVLLGEAPSSRSTPSPPAGEEPAGLLQMMGISLESVAGADLVQRDVPKTLGAAKPDPHDGGIAGGVLGRPQGARRVPPVGEEEDSREALGFGGVPLPLKGGADGA
ncbi:trypsin-like peptidase domain-containing protein [bacterium]|nr:trypsin-like peptidase domain-containing protein [bacterium]